MKKVALGIALLVATAGAAMAADMPVKMPVKAPPIAAPVYNWTGFYIGGHGGYLWDQTDYTSTFAGFPGPSGSFDVNGGFGGGQIGVDYSIGNRLVIGAVADISATGAKGETVPDPQNQFPSLLTSKIEWMATFRGRIGIEAGPALFYATGGLALVHAKAHDTNIGQGFNEGAGSETFTGWTAGAGIEVMLTPNISVMAEYLHIGLSDGDITFAPAPLVGSNESEIDLVKGGINFRFN